MPLPLGGTPVDEALDHRTAEHRFGRGKPTSRNAFGPLFARALRNAEAPTSTTFHALRHFYASLLIRYGENVKVV